MAIFAGALVAGSLRDGRVFRLEAGRLPAVIEP
jgi:hypothetical protein